MRIGIVTSGFDPNKPGGVSRVVLSFFRILEKLQLGSIEIISFSNSMRDSHSVQLFKPNTYTNQRTSINVLDRMKIINVGTFGSEFEALRYRKRYEMTDFFNNYDLLIVVTGVLNFANVIPKTKAKVIVQCATRLKWERESQYSQMRWSKRFVLKLQLPFLILSELAVIHSNYYFLVENQRFWTWLKPHTKYSPRLWYPGTVDTNTNLSQLKAKSVESQFVALGRLSEARKGWSRLFTAYGLAKDLDPSLPMLNVVGWGELQNDDKTAFDRIVSKHPIKIFKNSSEYEKNQILENSTIFLQTSYEEGLGLAMIEAMSHGLFILASETDGSHECVDNSVNGLLVRQGWGFVERFAETILSIRKFDTAEGMARSRSIFLEKFSDSRAESDLKKLLVEIIGLK